jgi:hypothetical protein
MLKFKAIEMIRNRLGVTFIVENPEECDDFLHIVGKVVEVDDERFEVLNVERFAHSPPWHKGEKIGLLVRKPVIRA